MARIRSIHPAIWHDEQFVMLSIEARLLLLELGSASDYADEFDWRDRPAMDELVCAGLVERHGDRGTIRFLFGFPRRSPSRWERTRRAVFARDAYTCQYCGAVGGELHCDHVVPVSAGGGNEMENLKTACAQCNLSKHDLPLDLWLRRRAR